MNLYACITNYCIVSSSVVGVLDIAVTSVVHSDASVPQYSVRVTACVNMLVQLVMLRLALYWLRSALHKITSCKQRRLNAHSLQMLQADLLGSVSHNPPPDDITSHVCHLPIPFRFLSAITLVCYSGFDFILIL